MTMSVRSTIARNTVFNAGGRLWEAAISLVLTWYIVLRLDTAGWGLWSLVGVFTAYAALFDFGVSAGFAKYIAEYAARKEARRLSAVLSTGLFFYFVFGAAIVAAGWVAVDVLMDWVVAPRASARTGVTPNIAELKFLLRGALILFAANNCLAPFMAAPIGLQRMGLSNGLSIISSALKLAVTVAFLETGFGLPGLLYTNAVVLLVQGAASIALAYWLMPGLRIGLSEITRSCMGELFSFGWRAQVAKLANLVNFQTDRLIIVWFYGNLGWVGLYRLGEELAGKMRQAPALLVTALLPAASDMDARGQQEELRRLYLVSTKYMASVSVPLAIYFCAAADILMHAWLGNREGLDTAAWVLRILVIGYLMNLLPGPGVSIVLGKGRADLPMYAGIISTAGNILFTIGLVYGIGFYGVPLGTTFGMLISTMWFFWVLRKHLALSSTELMRVAVAWPALASLPGASVCLMAQWILSGQGGHLPNLLGAGATAAIFGMLYVVTIGRTPFLDAFDVTFLETTLHAKRLPGFGLLTWRARRV